MTTAFVLGNGVSRKGIDLQSLQKHGPIYGCNALYREFTPDVLVAADKKISEHIQHSGYAQTHCFYTRRPLSALGARRVPEQYWGYSSGQMALGLAAIDRHAPIYFLGFDMGPVNQKFNNVYADTEFYKRSSDVPTYTGNWITQTISIAKDFPHVEFVRIAGSTTAPIPDFDKITNIKHMSREKFCETFGI